jgi:alkylated DNA repair dioxygenase AlkB
MTPRTALADGWQASLFAGAEPSIDAEFTGLVRHPLSDHSWIDEVRGWLSGSDEVFAQLAGDAERWNQREVVMYHRVLPEPRLTRWWRVDSGDPPPTPLLDLGRRHLCARYARPFVSIGCNWYRDGRDSVAWHRDRVRHLADPIVAILTLGEPRPLLLRPFGGGPSRSFTPGHGDLLVMGGRCQHEWEHTVPKVRRAGPRISVTYRHDVEPPGDAMIAPL